MSGRSYYFIRHALPLNDAGSFHLSAFDRDVAGEMDESLSEEGKGQAVAAAAALRSLRLQRIVSSTLRRAGETAGILSAETGIPHDRRYARLIEVRLGSYPPAVHPAVRAMVSRRWPPGLRSRLAHGVSRGLTLLYFAQWYRGKTSGGESLAEIYGNVDAMLRALDGLPEERIAVVGHSGWIAFLATRILGGSLLHLLRLSPVANCSFTRVDSDGRGAYRLRYFARPSDRVLRGGARP